MSRVSLGLGLAPTRGGDVDAGGWMLPRNLLTQAGVVIEDFETAADWTVTGGSCAVSADDVHHTAGSKGLQLAVADDNPGKIDKVIAWDLAALKGNMRLDVYNGTGALLSNVDVQVYLASVANYAKYFAFAVLGPLQMGWNTLNILEADWINNGGESWANSMVRIRITVVNAGGTTLTFDNLRGGIVAQPAVMLCFDDGLPGEYSQAYAYMGPRKVRGTLYCVTDLIGTAGFLTVGQVQALAAAGWTIGNHTDEHLDLTGASEAAQETALGAARGAIEGWGGADGGKQVAYPFGKYNANTLLAMAATGMQSGRLASAATSFKRNPVLPLAGPYAFEARFPTDAQSLAVVKGWLDAAVARGEVLVLGFHELGGAGAWTVRQFQDFVDYAIASGVAPLTALDLVKLQAGPAPVPRPVALLPFADNFGRADGALGNGWSGATWAIASGKAVNTPAAGAEMVANGEFTADTTGWTANNATLSRVDSTSEPGTNSGGVDKWALKLVDAGAAASARSGDLGAVVNGFYLVKARAYWPSAGVTVMRAALWVGTTAGGSEYGGVQFVTAEDAWQTLVRCVRATGAALFVSLYSDTGNNNDVGYFDAVSVKALTLASLFATRNAGRADVAAQAAVTRAAGTQAGLVLNLDSAAAPANFVVAYLDGAGNAKLDKCVAGVYTSVISGAVTYGAGKVLRVVKSGTSYSLYYDGAQVGTTQTIADAGLISNTLHGLFATSSGCALDDYSLAAT